MKLVANPDMLSGPDRSFPMISLREAVMELTERETRLVRYALLFLRSSLAAALTVEAAQEMAPDTQRTGTPLPDVPEAIAAVLQKLPHAGQAARIG